jgi:hypothetical protein
MLALTTVSLPGAGRSAEAELEGLRAVFGQVETVDPQERVLMVDRLRVRVPDEVAGFELLRPGQRVVVHLDPKARTPTATSIEVVR